MAINQAGESQRILRGQLLRHHPPCEQTLPTAWSLFLHRPGAPGQAWCPAASLPRSLAAAPRGDGAAVPSPSCPRAELLCYFGTADWHSGAPQDVTQPLFPNLFPTPALNGYFLLAKLDSLYGKRKEKPLGPECKTTVKKMSMCL